jgi:hypothetical protein
MTAFACDPQNRIKELHLMKYGLDTYKQNALYQLRPSLIWIIFA